MMLTEAEIGEQATGLTVLSTEQDPIDFLLKARARSFQWEIQPKGYFWVVSKDYPYVPSISSINHSCLYINTVIES